MLFSVEQAFVGRDEKRVPRKTPAWEASNHPKKKLKTMLEQNSGETTKNIWVYL